MRVGEVRREVVEREGCKVAGHLRHRKRVVRGRGELVENGNFDTKVLEVRSHQLLKAGIDLKPLEMKIRQANPHV